ncbi:LmeA family phospholipid-binding protein [Nocardiopsis halotolerans]|uniref:LmeA family phospholipid-binding protein n=1 Tax=Nocardiopsis halotolerans TaxID=124252 RepID=UPI00035FF4EC|nr:DUF2993 domain-containing protein [Nocardiopsis halotolerans]
MRKFLVVLLLLLVAVVVAADVGARSFAQNLIAGQAAQQLQMEQEPEVSVEGWAFLPQAISGTYSEIDISAPAATVGDVHLEQIDATATDVEAPLAELIDQPRVVAGQLEGSAVLPYSFFNPHLPEGVTIITEGGEPRITGELALSQFGVSTSVSAGGEFTVDGDTVTVTPTDIQLDDAPPGVDDMVANTLSFSFQVPQLPFGLTVTEVEPASSGVRFAGTAQDVPIMGSEAV